jgi:hypothetical protein
MALDSFTRVEPLLFFQTKTKTAVLCFAKRAVTSADNTNTNEGVHHSSAILFYKPATMDSNHHSSCESLDIDCEEMLRQQNDDSDDLAVSDPFGSVKR